MSKKIGLSILLVLFMITHAGWACPQHLTHQQLKTTIHFY